MKIWMELIQCWLKNAFSCFFRSRMEIPCLFPKSLWLNLGDRDPFGENADAIRRSSLSPFLLFFFFGALLMPFSVCVSHFLSKQDFYSDPFPFTQICMFGHPLYQCSGTILFNSLIYGHCKYFNDPTINYCCRMNCILCSYDLEDRIPLFPTVDGMLLSIDFPFCFGEKERKEGSF